MRLLYTIILAVLFSGCSIDPPVKDYTLAKVALEAAQTAGGSRYAPGSWYKAEDNYRMGEDAFKKGKFDKAKEYFVKSKLFSERSENRARVEKRKSGEDLP